MDEVKIIKLPKMENKRGNLTYFEDHSQVPFKIERVFWTYDVPGGEIRWDMLTTNRMSLLLRSAGALMLLLRDKIKLARFSQ